MVAVQPTADGGEEATNKIEVEEEAEKEPQNLCSKHEEVAADSKEASDLHMPVEEPQINEEDDGCDEGFLRVNSIRPAKRKQMPDKQNLKRPRGILKLRSKTIRIMK